MLIVPLSYRAREQGRAADEEAGKPSSSSRMAIGVLHAIARMIGLVPAKASRRPRRAPSR